MSIYEFNVIDRTGNEVSLSQYEGKVLLIVNTATECGFTPHYEDLQAFREFIANNKDKIGTIYSFGSAAILATYKYVQKVCEEHGVKLAAEEFHCRGEFMGRHVGHPDNVDIANVKLFAQRVLDSNK